jgi:hypothetical protein
VVESHVEYEAGEKYSEEFVFMVAKAANQLGVNYRLQFRNRTVKTTESNDDGHMVSSQIYRFPVVAIPEEFVESVERRAMFLHDREQKSLPVDPLPDGSWPDSEEEYTAPVVVNVATDEERRAVVLDLGRPLQAMTIHPSAARSLAMWLMATANQVGGELDADDTIRTRVAHVTDLETGMEKQASLEFRDFFVDGSSQDNEG